MKRKILLLMALLVLVISCASCSRNTSNTNVNANDETVELTTYGNMSVTQISRYFKRVQKIFDDDQGNMWGKKLAFHIMIVNEETHEAICSCQSKSGLFQQNGDVFISKLPQNIIVADSTIDYDGEKWATVLNSTLNGDEDSKVTLCVHELFHLNQPLLGFTNEDYKNFQMDEMDARISVKMEWNALEQAIHADGDSKKEHVKAALAFRNARREKYNSTKDEDNFEIIEGLAEYTSELLVYGTDRVITQKIPEMRMRCDSESDVPSYVRFFGYYSGLLYGTLLDEYSNDWRVGLRTDSNLGDLLSMKAGIDSTEISIDSIKDNYDYNTIYAYEEKREERQEQRNAKIVDMLENEKILKFDISKKNFGFDPQSIYKLDSYGTVYKNFNCSDEWGVFDSKEIPVVVSSDEMSFKVSAESLNEKDNMITGNGWNLTLSDGYKLKETSDGSYTIVRD